MVRGPVAIPDGRVGGQVEHCAKYVVSSTLEDPDWNNSTVIRGDVLEAVAMLTHEFTGTL